MLSYRKKNQKTHLWGPKIYQVDDWGLSGEGFHVSRLYNFIFLIFGLICILKSFYSTLITLVFYFVKQSCTYVSFLEYWGALPKRCYKSQSPCIVIACLRSSWYRELLEVPKVVKRFSFPYDSRL